MKKIIVSIAVVIAGLIIGFFIIKHFYKLDAKIYEKVLSGKCVCGSSGFLLDDMSLTISQKEKIKLLDKDFNSRLNVICNKLCVKKDELDKLLQKSEKYNKEISDCISEMLLYQAEMEKETAIHILDIKKELDEKQRKKFMGMISNKLCGDRK